MSRTSADVQVTLTIPRGLATCFATPDAVKAHLLAWGVWPDRVTQERWRIDPAGWVVDLTLAVPMPRPGGGPP